MSRWGELGLRWSCGEQQENDEQSQVLSRPPPTRRRRKTAIRHRKKTPRYRLSKKVVGMGQNTHSDLGHNGGGYLILDNNKANRGTAPVASPGAGPCASRGLAPSGGVPLRSPPIGDGGDAAGACRQCVVQCPSGGQQRCGLSAPGPSNGWTTWSRRDRRADLKCLRR